MAEERVSVPNIGDAHDVAVVEVLVQPGARVEREQALVVLESDKASMEIPSPLAGVVREITVKVGDNVSEGSPLLVIDTEDGAAKTAEQPEPDSVAKPADKPAAKPAAQPDKAAAKPAPKPAPKPATTPDEAPDSEVSEGSQVQPSAEAVEPQLEPSPPLAADDDSEEPASEPAEGKAKQTRTIPPAPPLPAPSEPPKSGAALPYASPAIRSFARELGVDLGHVPGSGDRGRITKDDVQNYVKHALSVATAAAPVGLTLSEAPEIDFSKFGEISVQPLTKIQRVSGKNLHRSWVTIPHVTQFDSADITELEAFRQKMKGDQPKVKLTLVTFFMKALVTALKDMPRFNSSLDKTGENLIVKSYYHIGVAVDTPNGLIVPVIRDVDIKSLGQLAKELGEISERARARRLAPNDLQGASMTISSLGGIGGTAFTPIINPPEVAVLGVSRSQWSPVYENGVFVPRLLCPLSLSYDHRVIDGADAARFTKRLGEILADIRQMLL